METAAEGITEGATDPTGVGAAEVVGDSVEVGTADGATEDVGTTDGRVEGTLLGREEGTELGAVLGAELRCPACETID